MTRAVLVLRSVCTALCWKYMKNRMLMLYCHLPKRAGFAIIDTIFMMGAVFASVPNIAAHLENGKLC